MTDTRELMANAKFFEGYSRYIDSENRYESWNEAVKRVMDTHRTFFSNKMTPELANIIDEIEEGYKDKLFLGAQRALQFGGDQLLKNHCKLFNCSASYADRASVFQETMFLLLSGAGVGLSILKKYVNKLPEIKERKKAPKVFAPDDSIEGWANCVGVLMSSYFIGGGTFPEYEGRKVLFDLTKIRPKGAMISGGFKAPGPEPLRVALDKIEYLLQGLVLKGIKRLRPIHVYDIVMHSADAVLAGGVRRSATIVMFDPDDDEMSKAKTGNWFVENPQRGRSNNSALLIRSEVTKDQFHEIMNNTREFGEPGFIWAEDDSVVYNPCFTGDTLVAVADGRNAVSIKQLAEEDKNFPVYSGKRTPKKKWKPQIKWATAFKTGTRNVVTVSLSNGDSFRCTPEHRLALEEGGYIKAIDSVGKQIAEFYTTKTKYRTINSETNGFARQYRMIWEFNNGPKPFGYEIDHLENNGNDSIENLQLLKTGEHLDKTAGERTGENNPIFRVRNADKWKRGLSRRSFLGNNPRFKGVTNEQLIQYGKELLAEGKKISFGALYAKDHNCPMAFSKNRFGGKISNLREICEGKTEYVAPENLPAYAIEENRQERDAVFVTSVISNGEIEDVYDLNVEDNHNFYIITSSEDEKFFVCRGVLVHNCCEIGMYPRDEETGESGFQFCCLSEINGSKCSSKEEFFKACRLASAICTLQAAYTDFPYLGSTTEKIVRTEALIGVSITGWMNNPNVLFDEKTLHEGARIVKETNAIVSKLIGINPAARCTTTKPSGNASVLLMTASGIHGEHSPRYIRNVQMNKEGEVAKLIKEQNPYMVENSVWSTNGTDYVVAFPVETPEGSIFKSDLDGVKMLEKVRFAQEHWIEAGTNVDLCVNPTIRHNISNTVVVDDWQSVEDYVYDNREAFAGISFLPKSGDKDFCQAPFTEVLTEEQIVERYGAAALFASGLIVDGLKVYKNLWTAIDSARNSSVSDQETNDNGSDWNRRFFKFADNYFEGDTKKAEYCLKDVFLLHKWCKIVQNFKPIDFVSELQAKKFTEIDTMGAIACSGGACEISF